MYNIFTILLYIYIYIQYTYTFIKHKFTQPANYNNFSYSFYIQKYIYL